MSRRSIRQYKRAIFSLGGYRLTTSAESLKMFMLPDGLHKAAGKTLEGPAVTKAQHTLKEGSERQQWGVY